MRDSCCDLRVGSSGLLSAARRFGSFFLFATGLIAIRTLGRFRRLSIIGMILNLRRIISIDVQRPGLPRQRVRGNLNPNPDRNLNPNPIVIVHFRHAGQSKPFVPLRSVAACDRSPNARRAEIPKLWPLFLRIPFRALNLRRFRPQPKTMRWPPCKPPNES